jgi:hypothetical protein
MTGEGLDLQVALAKVRRFRNHHAVAPHWAQAVHSLRDGVYQVIHLPQGEPTEVEEVPELWELYHRLSDYLRQAYVPPPSKRGGRKRNGPPQTKTPKKRKPNK